MTNVSGYGPGASWVRNQFVKSITFVLSMCTFRPLSQDWLPGRSPAVRMAHWTSRAGASATRTAAGLLANVGCGFFFGGTANPLQPATATLARVTPATTRVAILVGPRRIPPRSARPGPATAPKPSISPSHPGRSGRLPAVVTAASPEPAGGETALTERPIHGIAGVL